MKRSIPRTAALVALTLFLGLAGTAQAQAPYPSRAIRMVVPYAAGGGLDSVTRLVTQAMSEGLGQSIVVDNRAGGGGMIGAESVAKAAPDGYTLLMAGNPELVINPTLSPALRYNVTRDFIPIMLVAESPNILAAYTGVKGSLAEILAGKSVDGAVSIGSPGPGSPQHMAIEIMKASSKAELVHVPYKGAAPAVADALGGQTKLVLVGSPPLMPHIRSGKLRALAVTQGQRSKLVPDIPTMEEATGVKGVDIYTTWYGLLAPANTPPAIVEQLQKSIAGVLARPEIRARLAEMGTEVVALPGAQFGERMRTELRRHEEVIKRFSIKSD